LSLLCKASVIHVHSDAFAKDIQDLQCKLKERDDADTRLNKHLILTERAHSRSDAKLQDHHIKIQDLIESKNQNELQYQKIESICALVPTMQKDLVRFGECLDEHDGEIHHLARTSTSAINGSQEASSKKKNSKLFIVDHWSTELDEGNPPEYSSLLQPLPAARSTGEFNEIFPPSNTEIPKEGPFMNNLASSILLDHSDYSASSPGLKRHGYEVLKELEEDGLVSCCPAGSNEGPFLNKSVSSILPLNHPAEILPGGGRDEDEQERHDSEGMKGDYGPFIM